MRRRLLLLVPLLLSLADRAQADPPDPANFVRLSGAELAAVVRAASSPEDKLARLRPFLDRVVDEAGIARFCLGRHWNTATPAQRTEYVRLFKLVLLRGVVSRLGDYQAESVKVTIKPPVTRVDAIDVPTVVERAGNKPVNVTWVLVTDGPSLRIADVVAEGMSLRMTQRSDYASYLARNGGDVDTLIAAMKAQLGE